MPIDYTMSNGLLEGRASGVLDDATLIDYVNKLIADPRYDECVSDLFDTRAVTSLELTPDGLRTVATIIRQTGRSSPRVAIIADSPAVFGMARMFELLREDIEVRVFREPESAHAWVRARDQSAGDVA